MTTSCFIPSYSVRACCVVVNPHPLDVAFSVLCCVICGKRLVLTLRDCTPAADERPRQRRIMVLRLHCGIHGRAGIMKACCLTTVVRSIWQCKTFAPLEVHTLDSRDTCSRHNATAPSLKSSYSIPHAPTTLPPSTTTSSPILLCTSSPQHSTRFHVTMRPALTSTSHTRTRR